MLIFSAALFFITTFLIISLSLLPVWFALNKAAIVNAPPEGQDTPPQPKLLRDESISTISAWARLLERFDFIELMKVQIAQADLNWSVGRVTLSMLLAGAVALVVLIKGDWLPGWMNAALAYAASLTPYLYIWRRRRKRLAAFELQFPDVLDSLSRALRAGHPFAVALETVAGESDPPISTELRRASMEGNFGASWRQALENLSTRVPLLEVNMFAAAVQLHSRTGGKLSEVLAILSEGMRESQSLKGEVRAIAAHGKLTGLVLTILPPGIALVMAAVNPSYLAVLITNPYGKYLIAGAIVCLALAHLIIRRIVDIKV